MIEFHASLTPNAQKVWILLEELELPYDLRFVNVWKGEQFSDAFRALTPVGKVPVIVDPEGPDGTPFTVFESGAILFYLAEKHGRFLPPAGVARHEAMKWLMVQMSGQGPMSGQFTHFRHYAPPGNDYALARYTSMCVRLYETFEARLAEVPWLDGSDYSIADIASFPWIRQLARANAKDEGFFTPGDPRFPHLWDWVARISARSAVARALAQIDARPSTAAQADDDDRDRFFQRGRYIQR